MTGPGTKAERTVITSGYFPPVAVVGLDTPFCIMGLTFLAVQKTLRGTKQRKGALFGVAHGGMCPAGTRKAYMAYSVSLFCEYG